VRYHIYLVLQLDDNFGFCCLKNICTLHALAPHFKQTFNAFEDIKNVGLLCLYCKLLEHKILVLGPHVLVPGLDDKALVTLLHCYYGSY